MKIAVIGSKGLPPRQGGIEHHCAEIYPRLAAQGHQVVVYGRASYHPSAERRPYLYRGVRVVNLPSVPVRGADALVNSALAALLASRQNFDIIHFHALGPSLFTWIPRLLAPRTQVVVTCHGLDWQRAKWGNFSSWLIRQGERAAVRFAHVIGVVSRDLQRYLKVTYGRDSVYISNAPASYALEENEGDNCATYGLTSGRYLVFLGRLVPEKCPDLLIRAFQQLRPPGWKLALIGGTSDTSDYLNQLKGMVGNDPTIRFTGELWGAGLAEVMRGAGLFVLPSEVEGLPLALLEAMQEGVPALASDIPVHRELLGDDRGLLFQMGNLDHCVAALNWAVQNPDALRARAAKAQDYVRRHHNWEQIVADWQQVYAGLATRPVLTPAAKS
ncbi:glycosyltransferase family 4 protein [Nodosilinea sp. PGN35]|uniref:glycosyltransferase family 4 protein n=1 Tax=Nodosilinea sp. PGN35 TaxID=3020489 RepID=UPI0023B24788|nr:glycosyltransferase family 4 protein [Nodosilinea sp. TSF1-S3]MDF0367027.1 glycosyltransferase family 4 protein [Nodosilinea sp. TSF1-S3]